VAFRASPKTGGKQHSAPESESPKGRSGERHSRGNEPTGTHRGDRLGDDLPRHAEGEIVVSGITAQATYPCPVANVEISRTDPSDAKGNLWLKLAKNARPDPASTPIAENR
jgi:hypothetical protein